MQHFLDPFMGSDWFVGPGACRVTTTIESLKFKSILQIVADLIPPLKRPQSTQLRATCTGH